MKIIEFVKKELSGWKIFEIILLLSVICLIVYNMIFLKDSIIAVCSAFFGILYTLLAGKGKISCYLFGLMGSGCYITLSFLNALWGNMLLYVCYYIPMQVLGIFKWKQHLKKDTKEIIKTKLSTKHQFILFIISIIGCIITIYLLKFFNDKSPIIDGITTFLSIIGMYLTVKRAIEQWIIWIIVNGLSFLMWLNLVINGTKAYSTLVMWGVYFVLAIYFYFNWKQTINLDNHN